MDKKMRNEFYDIMIEGKTAYTRLSEEEFFDTIEELSEGYYENKEIPSSAISFTCYKDTN